ncbi:uncharacterized protein LAESUDRAFT_734628 [Laetiporus sulphureus 93-53]|uniref:BZIP domain-containing protein n=1 Tax=Laetiporus sulphureus 93-53 TaxID=1314785 RepID=A0A165GW38_9APHY|nr:uncharacterized protein LAESUDRAFT_734628 [Laetiporus sulphureus 93-53]KZT10906.1 hypothetical protein LAESUDRAFT_734628 [Laetiporus sulphureus 93-53]
MAPSHLQGLNIVQPSPPATPSFLSDADLLSLPAFPELSAQLDLWTNLHFQSDEPLGLPLDNSAQKSSGLDGKGRYSADASEDDLERYNDQEGAIAETRTVLPPTGVAHSAPSNPAQGIPNAGMQLPLDISSLLAGIGMDPFLVPPAQHAAQQTANANSIAQLLSLHAASFLPPHLQPPSSTPPAQSQQVQEQAPSPSALKRVRTARSSFSEDVSLPGSPIDDRDPGTPLAAAEDKRRRNTAASARFRLKKKEREAALERKAKELEVRVSELEKECEALRRENGWLKGLVVGQVGSGTNAPLVAGTKRSREDGEGGKKEQ